MNGSTLPGAPPFIAFVVVYGVQVLAGLVLLLVAVPLWRRRIAPNALYGFRIRATMQDTELWYEANAYVGRDMVIASLVYLVAIGAIAVAVPSTAFHVRALAPLAVLLTGLVAAAAGGMWFVHRDEARQGPRRENTATKDVG